MSQKANSSQLKVAAWGVTEATAFLDRLRIRIGTNSALREMA